MLQGTLVNLPGIFLLVLRLRRRGRLTIPLYHGHMTPTVHGTDDLIVWYLLHRPLAPLLARLLLVMCLLDLSLLLRRLLLGMSPCLLLGGLPLGTLLCLTLRLDLRGRLAYRALRTRLLTRCNGLLRLAQLLCLLLPLVRGISLAIILACLLRGTLTCLTLGIQTHFLASEPALDGLLGLGWLAALTTFLLLLLTTQTFLGRLLLGHLTATLLLGSSALCRLATCTLLLGSLELDLLA